MNSPLFPDVNVWVALNSEVHTHHATAKQWYDSIPPSTMIVFCRQTQLGLFRILTTAAVMGQEVLTQLQ
jgi:predicted nucleic acid-binding protein